MLVAPIGVMDKPRFSLSLPINDDNRFSLLLTAEFWWKSNGEGARCEPYLWLEFIDRSCGSSSPLQLLLSEDCASSLVSDRRSGVMVPVGEARARSSAGDICKQRKNGVNKVDGRFLQGTWIFGQKVINRALIFHCFKKGVQGDWSLFWNGDWNYSHFCSFFLKKWFFYRDERLNHSKSNRSRTNKSPPLMNFSKTFKIQFQMNEKKEEKNRNRSPGTESFRIDSFANDWIT